MKTLQNLFSLENKGLRMKRFLVLNFMKRS